MFDDTWELMEQRGKLKMSGANKEFNSFNSRIQAACCKNKNLDLQNICEELEHNAQKFETKDLHMKIRTITRQFKPKNWVIESCAGDSVTEIKGIVRIWREYCTSLFTSTHNTTDSTIITTKSNEQEPNILKD